MEKFRLSACTAKGEGLTGGRTGATHVVQFYDDETFLCQAAVRFLADGLRAAEPLIVIATALHRDAFVRSLTLDGFDVEALVNDGQVTLLDARETLSAFMNGNTPDPQLFTSNVGGIIRRIQTRCDHRCVRAFGEMVDLLWRDGNGDGAIRLEELWNELARTHSFSLLCAYAMESFDSETHLLSFQDICNQHGQVMPTEHYLHMDDGARSREISRLQHRARALETEIKYRKRLEKELRAARAEAEKASRLKDEFLAVVSHELRTPLTPILGWTHLIDASTDRETMCRAFEVVQRNAALQLRLIDDLLDVSRVVSGKMVIHSGPVDLFPLLNAAVESIRPAAFAKQIELDIQTADPGCFVTGDSDRLQQVVWNLLSNAVKFAGQNGRIELRLEEVDSHARIVVRDNGQGIPPAFLPFVFDPFRQADTSITRKHGGLGVGLAVARYLVEAQGGTIEAHSEGEGMGATFVISLPLHQPSR